MDSDLLFDETTKTKKSDGTFWFMKELSTAPGTDYFGVNSYWPLKSKMAGKGDIFAGVSRMLGHEHAETRAPARAAEDSRLLLKRFFRLMPLLAIDGEFRCARVTPFGY